MTEYGWPIFERCNGLLSLQHMLSARSECLYLLSCPAVREGDCQRLDLLRQSIRLIYKNRLICFVALFLYVSTVLLLTFLSDKCVGLLKS